MPYLLAAVAGMLIAVFYGQGPSNKQCPAPSHQEQTNKAAR